VLASERQSLVIYCRGRRLRLRSLTNYRQVRAGLLLLIVSIDLQIYAKPPMGD